MLEVRCFSSIAMSTDWHRLMIAEIEDLQICLSRILQLALLAPDIIETILAGRTDQTLMLEKLERPLLVSWVEQRARILKSKTSLAV